MSIIGSAITTDHIGEIVRLRVKCWSKRIAQRGGGDSGSGSTEEDEGPTNCEKEFEGMIACVAKNVIGLQGCVELDLGSHKPVEASLPPSPERARGNRPNLSGYSSRTFLTIQRKRILSYMSIDDLCDKPRSNENSNGNEEENEEDANNGTLPPSPSGSIVEHSPDDNNGTSSPTTTVTINDTHGQEGLPNTSFQTALDSSPEDRIFRYQLLCTLARMHAVPDAERDLRQRQREEEESARRRRGEGDDDVAAAGENASRREPIHEDGQSSTINNASRNITPAHSRTPSGVTPHHQRVLSTGSAVVSVDPTRQEMFDDFVNNQSVIQQWTRFHNRFWSLPPSAAHQLPPISSSGDRESQAPTLLDAVEVNQRDARNAQIRRDLGVHSVLQLVTESKSEVEKMVDDQSHYNSNSSRRRFSPYALRLSRIRTLLRRMFAIQSIAGILLALCGGILAAQSLVTPVTDGQEMIVAYAPLLWHLCIAPAILAVLLGICLALSAKWTGRLSKNKRKAVAISSLLILLTSVPALVNCGIHLNMKEDMRNREEFSQFFAREVQASSKLVCDHMHFFGCSGWDNICMRGAAADKLMADVVDKMKTAGYNKEQWVKGNLTFMELSKILPAAASDPNLEEYLLYCPQNCSIVEEDSTAENANHHTVGGTALIDLKYDFSPSRSCGGDLKDNVKDLCVEFVVLLSLIDGTLLLYFLANHIAFEMFLHTVRRDPPIH